MKRPQLGAAVFSIAAALLLAALRDSAALRDGAPAGSWPAWAESGAAGGLALGTALAAFWIFAALRAGSWAARRVNPEAGRAGHALWTFFYAYVFVLFCVTVLSAAAVIAAPGRRNGGGETAQGFAESARARSAGAGAVAWMRDHPLAAAIIGTAGAVTLVNAVWGFLLPPFAHDDFTYHLVFPVEWMQSGTFTMKAVPFGNHSPPYYPMNTEMFYLWLLLPFRDVFHVNAAQAVFLIFSAAALYEIFRRCGASGPASAAAASLFTVSPAVVQELSKAYVDIAFACFFLVALNAALEFRSRPAAARAVQFALAAGVFAGTKIPGAAFTLMLLLPIFAIMLVLAHRSGAAESGAARRLRAGRAAVVALVAAALFVAGGGWWYLRNFIVTGNPVFPLTIKIFGATIFAGAYEKEVLPRSHIATLLDLYTTPVLIVLAIGAAWTAAAAAASAVRGRRGALPVRAFWAGIVLPGALAAIFHFLIPYDYARFVLAAAGLSGAVVLVLFDAGRKWIPIAAQSAVLLAVLIALAAPSARALLLLPCHPVQRLESSFAVWGSLALGCATIIGFVTAGLFSLSRVLRTWLAALLAAMAFGFIASGAAVADLGGAHFTKAMRALWEPYLFVHENYRGVSVAVTGTNRSFLLYGRDLSNRVRYVNVNDKRGWRFHDYVAGFVGSPSELLPGYQGAAYYRRNADYESWLANLDAFGADLLVVERLTPENVGQGYDHDARGFPFEAAWAEEHGERFERVYASPLVRIYEIL